MTSKQLPAALLALGLAFGASMSLMPAMAQQAPAQAPAEAPAATVDVGEDKLRSFAVATLEIQKITRQYQPRIQQAGSPEEQQDLARQANEEMVMVVEQAEGITVEEYNAIAESARGNPEMVQQINSLIAEASENPAR